MTLLEWLVRGTDSTKEVIKIPPARVSGRRKVSPFHSKNPNIPPSRRRYHDNSLCEEGNNIESYYWASGTGGHPRCHRCTTLAAQGR